MAKPREPELSTRALGSLLVLLPVVVELVIAIIDAASMGRSVVDAIIKFWKERYSILVSALAAAGIASGAWIGGAVWAGSLGFWSSIGYAVGIVSMPLWAPVAGGLLGFGVVGGATAGIVYWIRKGSRLERAKLMVALSRFLAGHDELSEPEISFIREILGAHGVEGNDIAEVVNVSAYTISELLEEVDPKGEEREQLARLVLPMAYAGDGVLSAEERGRFNEICGRLGMETGSGDRLVSQYEKELDNRWEQLAATSEAAQFLAAKLPLGDDAKNAMRQAVESLTTFDPRKSAAARRKKTLKALGSGAGVAAAIGLMAVEGPVAEAAIMGGYALVRSVVATDEKGVLDKALDGLLKAKKLPAAQQAKLKGSAKVIDAGLAKAAKRLTSRPEPK